MTTPAPLAQRVVSLAAGQVGLRESGGPNRGPPIARYAGGRVGEPWCAHYLAWLFRHVGAPLPGDVVPSQRTANPIARVETMWTALMGEHRQVYSPCAGDIVVFRSRVGSDAGSGWHCGLVEAVTDTRVMTIEGNSGDAVARRGYVPGDPRILGFARIPG